MYCIEQARYPDRVRARNMLERWGGTDRLCEQLNREMEKLIRMRCRMALYADEDDKCRVHAVMLEMESAIEQLSDACKKELQFARALTVRIQQLDSLYRRILHMRYREGCSYVQIGMRINRSEDHAKRLEAKAVDKLCAMLMTDEAERRREWKRKR